MTRQLCRATVLLALVALAGTASPAHAAARPRVLLGLFDDAQVYGNPQRTFPLLRSLRTQVLRVNLYWGGRLGGEPPKQVAPTFDDPAAYGPSGQPSVGFAALARQFTAPTAKTAYGYAVLQSWNFDGARTLKAAAPKTKTLVYKNMAATYSWATTDGRDNELLPAGVGYASARVDHPDWFLTDANGQPVESCTEHGRFLMDVGNPDYQAAWLAGATSDLQQHGWDGVLIDGASSSAAADLCGRPLAKYPTDAAYTSAVESFLARVAPALRERGFAVFADMRVPATADGQAVWSRWLSYLSGGALGGWTDAQGSAWDFQRSLQKATEDAGKPLLGLVSGAADTRAVRYARASFLLGWSSGASALAFDGNPPAPEAAVEVGKPVGVARQVGAVWERAFTEGTVVVNPSDKPATVKLDDTYMTPSGDAVSSVTLEPGSGLALRFPKLVGGNDNAVALHRPRNAADPADPAYDWSLYDRTVRLAAEQRIAIVFSIVGTPRWANGGLGLKHAPSDPNDLRDFAYAAAKRYSGTYVAEGGKPLPAVRLWLAWNEPNNPVFLLPQYKRVGGKWVMQSARDYAAICSAVYTGVHATLLRAERVGCGLTAPRGSNAPASKRPSVTPLVFLRELKRVGLKRFDAYAHHPYYNLPNETPRSKPHNRGAIEMGNLGLLIRELTTLYGKKRLWLTEYGYQTNDPKFGVSWSRQASYLREAYAMAQKTRRIDMLIWFLLRDDPRVKTGWQSGFFTAKGKRKPVANVFKALARG